jgi:WD40 repeat protein
VETGTSLRLVDHQEPLRSACFSPDGSKIFTVAAHSLKVWDVASGSLVRMEGPLKDLAEIHFSADGKLAVRADRSNSVGLINTESLRTNLIDFPFSPGGAQLSPDGSWLVVSTDDHTARLVY